jgi:hypothetical protein
MMRLVDDWRECWRWISFNCMTVAAALQGAWVYVPEDMRQSIPPELVSIITVLLLTLGIVGRLLKQRPRKYKGLR